MVVGGTELRLTCPHAGNMTIYGGDYVQDMHVYSSGSKDTDNVVVLFLETMFLVDVPGQTGCLG